MAGEKFDSKSFNPQAFGRYMETVPKQKLNALIKANIFRSNENIRSTFANQTGTGYAIIPMFGRLSGKPANYDGTTKYGEAKKLGTFERGVVTFGRKDKFSENDFSYDITSGVDFMSQIGSQLAEYWDDANEETLVAIINGIFGMTDTAGAEFVKKHTFETETVTATTLNKAIQQASGDRKAKYALVIMNSAIATDLENQKLLTYLTYNDPNGIEVQLNLAQWNGKLVLVDDSYTYDNEQEKYITYVLGNGMFDYEDLGAKVPYEMKREPEKDRDYLYSRERLCIAPYGISYTKKEQATLSPTDEELAKGENWELAKDGEGNYFPHKEIAIAKIVSSKAGEESSPSNTLRSIEGISKTNTEGLVDTYTITYSDKSTSTFTVTNGKDGAKGADGKAGTNGTNGKDGAKGDTGNGIESVALDSTSGLEDTYKITFTDGTSTTFTITNGKDGEDGEDGAKGADGKAGTNGTNGKDGVGISDITLDGTKLKITLTNETTKEIDLDPILNKDSGE